MNVYGIENSDQQIITSDTLGAPYILMTGVRPAGDYIADSGGNWIAGMTTQQAKLHGVEFDGVMCSATATDMFGLGAIKGYIEAGNSTRFYFDNGNNVLLTQANLASFEAVWIPFRQSFFPTS